MFLYDFDKILMLKINGFQRKSSITESLTSSIKYTIYNIIKFYYN